jgi:hypothetical protein
LQLTSTTTILTEPPCTQCSWCICLECNVFSVPTLDSSVLRTAYHVWKLTFADWHLTYAFENLSLCFVYCHSKACDQRWAVVRSTVSCHAINGELSTMRVAIEDLHVTSSMTSPMVAAMLEVFFSCHAGRLYGNNVRKRPKIGHFSWPIETFQCIESNRNFDVKIWKVFIMRYQWVSAFILSYHLHPEIPMGQYVHSAIPPASWDTNGSVAASFYHTTCILIYQWVSSFILSYHLHPEIPMDGSMASSYHATWILRYQWVNGCILLCHLHPEIPMAIGQ